MWCSNGSASNWLNKHRPKVSICPHKQDYCDTCAKHNASIHAKRTTLNRIRQSGSASRSDQKELEDDIASLESELEDHRTKARLSHENNLELTKRCREKMSKIKELEQKADKERELEQLKGRFTLTLRVDYQMSKLIPNWGNTPQPGSTYLLVSHEEEKSNIYIFDERAGPKNRSYGVIPSALPP